MRAILNGLIQKLVTHGTLTIRYPDGHTATFSGSPGPTVTLEIRSFGALRRLAINPGLAFGEEFMNGELVPIDCTVYDALDMLMAGSDTSKNHPILTLHRLRDVVLKRWAQFNPAGRARRNVAHHYDLNGRLYRLLLDRDLQYSCGYFPRGNETLDDAQAAKKRHIAAKLLLDRPDLSVLDIGCGWGGMAITLAREYGARVTGITLSTEQLLVARARAQEEGLSDRVNFELLDYRSMDRQFDRVVSIGMFEHVGLVHYPQFFKVVKRCLASDGVALLHAIGRSHGPSATGPWLAKYIFPGGYSPALSEVLPVVERSGLLATDIEILRLHYAETLRLWRRNFAAKRDAITAMYDEKFCRMFDMYLSGCELAFRRQGHMVFQIQLARDVAAVPIARDYMYETEHQAIALSRAA